MSMVLISIFAILAALAVAKLVAWLIIPEQKPKPGEIDPNFYYCHCDRRTAPDGSRGLCGSELDANDPDVTVPDELVCPECKHIEKMIRLYGGQWV